jgi:hypothetical protein
LIEILFQVLTTDWVVWKNSGGGGGSESGMEQSAAKEKKKVKSCTGIYLLLVEGLLYDRTSLYCFVSKI